MSISAGFVQGDALSVGSSQTGITSAYNAATGVLTLSGAASLAAYQKELDSVAYASAQATASSRTITWSVNDGVNTSAAATSHVSVSRLPPVLSAGASVGCVAELHARRARRRSVHYRCGGGQPDRGHGEHQRRLRSG